MVTTENLERLLDRARQTFDARRQYISEGKLEFRKLQADVNELALRFDQVLTFAQSQRFELPIVAGEFNARITLEKTIRNVRLNSEVSIQIDNPQDETNPYNTRYILPHVFGSLLKEENDNNIFIPIPVNEIPATLGLLREILGLAAEAIPSQLRVESSIDPDPPN